MDEKREWLVEQRNLRANNALFRSRLTAEVKQEKEKEKKSAPTSKIIAKTGLEDLF
jgi:hypothetical protein